MKNLIKSVRNVQLIVGTIQQVRRNDFAKFNYVDYTDVVVAISSALTSEGIMYYHTINGKTLHTFIVHEESGEQMESSSEILDMEAKGMNTYQVIGSGISYLKKYHLISMLGLATDEKSMDELIQSRKKPTLTDERFEQALAKINAGTYTTEQLVSKFELTKEQKEKLL